MTIWTIWRKISLVITFLSIVSFSFSQSIGIHLAPQLVGHLATDSKIVGASDSIRKTDGAAFKWQFGLDMRFALDKEWSIQTGLSISNLGFKRTREGLQFLDSIHPAIGRVEDLSDNGIKIATYTYEYTYLVVPLFFHYDISPRYKRQLYQHSFYFGPSFQYLIADELDIFTSGFSVAGSFDHKVEDTGYNPSQANIGFALGTRSQIRIESNLFVSLQPKLSLQLLNSGKDDWLKYNLFQATMEIGLNYRF